MAEIRKQEFLDKLSKLLKEYKADIHFEVEGDTYGIHSEKVVVDVDRVKAFENSGYWLEL